MSWTRVHYVCAQSSNAQHALAKLDAACERNPEDQARLMAREHLKKIM